MRLPVVLFVLLSAAVFLAVAAQNGERPNGPDIGPPLVRRGGEGGRQDLTEGTGRGERSGTLRCRRRCLRHCSNVCKRRHGGELEHGGNRENTRGNNHGGNYGNNHEGTHGNELRHCLKRCPRKCERLCRHRGDNDRRKPEREED